VRSREGKRTTKYICRGWKTCHYALKKKMGPVFQRYCLWGVPYVAPAYKASSYSCDQCNGIKITPEIELQIKIQLL
jgi:hypothetical protein